MTCVSITNQELTICKYILEKEQPKAKYIQLFYDDETDEIGFTFADKSEVAAIPYKIDEQGNAKININKFWEDLKGEILSPCPGTIWKCRIFLLVDWRIIPKSEIFVLEKIESRRLN